MKNKIILILLITVLALSACGKKDEEGNEDEQLNVQDSTVTDNTYDSEFDAVVDASNTPIDMYDSETTIGESTEQKQSTNILPQSTTTSKFTGETQSGGVKHTSVNQDNFHHIGKPVVKYPTTSESTQSNTKPSDNLEQSTEDVQIEVVSTNDINQSPDYKLIGDGFYNASDLKDNTVYFLVKSGIDWWYEYTIGEDVYKDSSDESSDAVVAFNSNSINSVEFDGCTLICIDFDTDALSGDSYSNGIFRCGVDFESGIYEFLEDNGDYYIVIYKADGTSSQMTHAPIAGIVYNTELNEGDVVYVGQGVKMRMKNSDEAGGSDGE